MPDRSRQIDPLSTGLKLLTAIVVSEIVIMVILHWLKAEAWMSQTMILLTNAVTLSIITLIVVYYWVINPMEILSEQTKEVEALRESEKRYNLLAEAAQDAIFIIGRDDQIKYVNSFAAKQFRCEPEEIIGKQRANLFSPEIAERQKQNLQKVFETGKPLYVEEEPPFLDRKIWMGTRLTPITNEEGKINAVLGVSRNINDQKLTERELISSKEFLKNIMESSADAIITT